MPMNPDTAFNVIVLGFGAALGWSFWQASKFRALFTVEIQDGQPVRKHGAVTDAFLRRVREVAETHGIDDGTINGYPHGRMIRLRFSREITPAARQQLRNWWAMSGWTAPASGCVQRGRCS